MKNQIIILRIFQRCFLKLFSPVIFLLYKKYEGMPVGVLCFEVLPRLPSFKGNVSLGNI